MAPLARMQTPVDEPFVDIWWSSPEAPPPWLLNLIPTLACATDRLPDSASIVIIPVADDISAQQAIHRTKQHGRRLVLLIKADLDERRLLEAGANLVISAQQADLAHARLSRFIETVIPLRDPSQRTRQDALVVASHLLSTVYDEEETFRHLVDILARELNSHRVSLMQVNRAEGLLEMRCAVGVPDDVLRSARAQIGEGIAGTCAQLGRPLFVDDHTRLDEGDLSTYVPHLNTPAPMSLTVPLLVKGEVVGVVNITDRADSRPYSRADISFVSALMAHAGYLLEHAELMAHLDASRAFSERVINSLSDPLVVVDDQFQVITANQRFIELFGPATSLWTSLKITPDQQASLKRSILEQSEKEMLGWVLANRTFDVVVRRFADGERDRHLVLLRDMTTRRQMERRLLSAEKMASLGVLSAGVAHEINNPIAFMKANVVSAQESFGDVLSLLDAWRAQADQLPADVSAALFARESELQIPEIRDDLALLFTETLGGISRVEAIVQSLRRFAHPDTQNARKVDISKLLESAILLTQGQWKYRLNIIRQFTKVPTLFCLPSQLEQVFMNLIVNAAQAAKDWEQLTISVEQTNMGSIRVEFADTCGGIPDDILSHVFEPFFTTKDVGEGTGLGLAISYNIIEGHGGQLTVRSALGQGTRFTVELPLGKAGPLMVKQHSYV